MTHWLLLIFFSLSASLLSQVTAPDTWHERVRTTVDSIVPWYPGLKDARIDIKSARQRTFMAARPRPISLFAGKGNRRYTIWVHSCPLHPGFGIVHLMPDSALRGIVAHELAHLAHYQTISAIRLAAEGVQYKVSGAYRSRYEAATDEAVIRQGLGSWLIAYARFVETCPCIDPAYRAYKQRYYYSAADLIKIK